MNEPTALVVLPRLQVQNANAISGSICWGFPPPTAFLGFAHALERRFFSELREGFGGVGIICHQFHPQICQSPGHRPHVFRLTRNPVGEGGGATALVEEGRAHMEISLVIAVKDRMPATSGEHFAKALLATAESMRVAGGSILPTRDGNRFSAQWWPLTDNLEGQTEVFHKLRRQLLPGFALVQREDLLAERLAEIRLKHPEGNALDALLDLSRLNVEPDRPSPDKPDGRQWGVREQPGWLVPLPVGYSALSPLYAPGKVRNARDGVTPFRFVEGLYSLGEWVGPHRLENVRQLLWHVETDPDNGNYRCINHYSAPFAID